MKIKYLSWLYFHINVLIETLYTKETQILLHRIEQASKIDI